MILGMQVWMTSRRHMVESSEALTHYEPTGGLVHGLHFIGTATGLHALVVYSTVGILKSPTTALVLKSNPIQSMSMPCDQSLLTTILPTKI